MGEIEKIIKNKIITESKKTKNLEGEPEFTKEEVVFYRIPQRFRELVRINEIWEGEITDKTDSGKTDKRGVKIFVCNFIPIRKINGVH